MILVLFNHVISPPQALHSTLCSLSEKRLALNTQMREWSVSDPRSLICGRLMEELGNVDREWDRVLTGLSEVPMSEASLFRQMVRNILKEVVAMETNLPQLQSRTVELKQVTEKLEMCAVSELVCQVVCVYQGIR